VNAAWVGALAALLGVMLVMLGWVSRAALRAYKKVDQFLEDWNGVPTDPGHEGRPGVMARMVVLEHGMADVQSQVHVNSGSSLRDVVMRTEGAVAELKTEVADIKHTLGSGGN
jgi:hypothetical protein